MALRNIVFFAILLFFNHLIVAQEDFNKGVKAFEDTEFENAAEFFLKHIESYPLDYEAYFNLGNAYYKQKKYPHALWAFEKSLKINPNNNDAVFNAKLSHDKAGLIGEWKYSSSLFSRILFGVPKNAWAISSLILALFLAIGLYFFFSTERSSTKRLFVFVNGALSILLVTTVILAVAHKNYLTVENNGIIVVATANAKVSPKMDDRTLFTIPGGQKVIVLREQDDWLEIQISAENVGWLQKDNLKLF